MYIIDTTVSPNNLEYSQIDCLGGNESWIDIYEGYLYEGEAWRHNVDFFNLGLLDFPENPNIVVYPNPISESLTINNIESESCYSIYNYLGQLILTGKIRSGKNINLYSLEKGIYFLKLDSEQRSIKLIKK